MRKKQKKKVFIGIGIFLLVSLLVGLFASGIIDLPFALGSEPLSGEYIQTPTFMYYECSPASSPVDSPKVNMNGGVAKWVRCPDNTDSCDLYIQQIEDTGLFSTQRRIVYQICDQNLDNCQAQVIRTTSYFQSKSGIPTYPIYGLNSNDRVYIDYQKSTIIGWRNIDGARYYSRYKPFILWKVSIFGGGKQEYSSISQGCNFYSKERRNLIDSVKDVFLKTSQSSLNDYKLEPYKTRNFLDNFVPVSTSNVNFVRYSGKDGYCLNRRIYNIGTVETNGATYRIIDTNVNSVLGNVECCPGDKEPTRKCSDNFKWEELVGSECSLFNPCAGSEYFPSGKPKELVQYYCDKGYCKPKTKEVECARDSDCIGNSKGSVCDTSLWECTSTSIPQSGSEICGNGLDDDGDGLVDDKDPECQNRVECKWWDFKCKLESILDSFFGVIKIILSAIVFIFALLFGKDIFSSFEAVKDKEWLAWIFAVIVSGLLAWLTFTLFWVGLIVFVVWIVFRLIVGGKIAKLKKGIRGIRK